MADPTEADGDSLEQLILRSQRLLERLPEILPTAPVAAAAEQKVPTEKGVLGPPKVSTIKELGLGAIPNLGPNLQLPPKTVVTKNPAEMGCLPKSGAAKKPSPPAEELGTSADASAEAKKDRPRASRFFLRGLKGLGEQNLIAYFSKFGEVIEASLLRDKKTKQSRGLGFVTIVPKVGKGSVTSSSVKAFLDSLLGNSHIINGVQIELQGALQKEEDSEKAPEPSTAEVEEPAEEAKPAPAAPAAQGSTGPGLSWMPGSTGPILLGTSGLAPLGYGPVPTAKSWKTRICTYFMQGFCQRGDGCSFAHGDHEMRPDVRNKGVFKTKVCQYFLLGRCPQGDLCSFAHSEDELQVTSASGGIAAAIAKAGFSDPGQPY